MDTLTAPADLLAVARSALLEALAALRYVMAQRSDRPSTLDAIRRAATTVLRYADALVHPAAPPPPARPHQPTPPLAPPPASPPASSPASPPAFAPASSPASIAAALTLLPSPSLPSPIPSPRPTPAATLLAAAGLKAPPAHP